MLRAVWRGSYFKTLLSSPRRRGPIPCALSISCGVWGPTVAALGRDDGCSSRRHDTWRGLHVVIQDRRQPALAFRDAPAFALGIILDLVALDLADAEIGAVRMAEIEPAHRRPRPHGIALGQFDA